MGLFSGCVGYLVLVLVSCFVCVWRGEGASGGIHWYERAQLGIVSN